MSHFFLNIIPALMDNISVTWFHGAWVHFQKSVIFISCALVEKMFVEKRPNFFILHFLYFKLVLFIAPRCNCMITTHFANIQ
jgi:hypothetical protein